MSYKTKQQLLAGFTGLIAAIVKNSINPSIDEPMFSSWYSFIGHWLIFYLLVLFTIGIFLVIMRMHQHRLMKVKSLMEVEEATTYVSVTLLIISFLVWFGAKY